MGGGIISLEQNLQASRETVDQLPSLFELLEERLLRYTPKSRLNKDNYFGSVTRLPRESVPEATEKQINKCLNGHPDVDFGVLYQPKGVRFSAPGLRGKEEKPRFVVRMTGGPHDFNGDFDTFPCLHYAVFEDSVYQLYADGEMRGLTYFWREIKGDGLLKRVVNQIKDRYDN